MNHLRPKEATMPRPAEAQAAGRATLAAIAGGLVESGGAPVLVASLDDIIKSKRAAGRAQDLAVLPVLEELRRTLEGDSAKPPGKRPRTRGR